MVADKVETLKKLVSVNEAFINRVNSNELLEVELYVKFEMALLFFRLNVKYISELNDNIRNFILSLIDSNDYVLEDDFVIFYGIRYKIAYVISLVDKIKEAAEVKREYSSDKIVTVDFISKKSLTDRKPIIKSDSSGTVCEVYDISGIIKDRSFTYEERAYIFERTTRIDRETLPFVEKNNSMFVSKMSENIYCILSGKDFNLSDKYVQLLINYLRMYPFVKYGKEFVSLELLDIPQNEIGLAKFVIKDDYLLKLDEGIQKLKMDRKIYLKQFHDFNARQDKLRRVAEIAEARVIDIDMKLYEYSYNYDSYVHDAKVYNHNFLTYLVDALGQGNVYIAGEDDSNPVIKFFVINNGEVVFFGGMRFKVFKNLIDPSKLITLGNGVKILEKKLD